MPTWTKEQNDAIYKSGTNILVSAGAGSGKTAVLTTRVIEKLKSGIHINELLILTFTKAAAGEMKERIRKKIKEQPELSSELSLLDSAYITTFDAFSLSVVKKYHYLLNITSSPKITDESVLEILKKDILRKVLDSYYDREDEIFFKFIEENCVKDDNEIYIALLNIAKKIENNFTGEETLENYISNYFQDVTIQKYLKEYNQILLTKQQKMKVEIEDLSKIASKEYIQKCYEQLNGILNSKDLDTLITYRSCKLPPLKKGEEPEVKEQKEKVNESYKELLKLLDYGNSDILKKDYFQMQESIDLFCKILKEYFQKLKYVKKEQEYFDFNDIAKYAIHLVKNYQEVQLYYKNQFKEIMIDEYQDTNDIQETFISYISQNNVYMVGDIKQSIYRFRNANPYLFKSKYDSYRTKINGEKIDLLKNFRSRQEVLTDINEIFNLIMDDDLGGANYLEEHQMIFGNKNYIEQGKTNENYHTDILTYSREKKSLFKEEEIEAFIIAQDIKKKIKEGYLLFDKDNNTVHKANYRDFVILMDRSTNFDLYKKIFNYLNVPLNIQKDESLNSSTIFTVLTNLIQLLTSYYTKKFDQIFKYSYTSIARSFLFERPDQEIYEVIKSKNWYQNPIYETLKHLINTMSTKTLNEIIENLYLETNIYEKIIKIGNIKENLTILNHMKELADNYGNNIHDIFSFSEFLNQIKKEELPIRVSIEEQAENSVTIMTIHKSKGLEYPVCYFSGLSKKFNISDVKEKYLFDSKYGFLVPLKEEGFYSCFVKELVKQNFLKEEISEKIRLFYVAVTRAKEKMIFVLPNKEKDISSRLECRSLADFLYLIWNNLKKFQIDLTEEEIKATKNYLYDEKKNTWQVKENDKILVKEINIKEETESQLKFSKSNFKLNTKEDYTNIKLGILMHEYLECIDFQNPNYNLIKSEFWRNKIFNFLNSSFMKKHINDNLKKEYEFIYEENKQEYHGIIDLLIENTNEIIILDYKLNNIIDEAYVKQLKGYRNYIRKKTNKPINLYLYSLLNEEFIELEKDIINI